MMDAWQAFGTLLLGATMMLYDGASGLALNQTDSGRWSKIPKSLHSDIRPTLGLADSVPVRPCANMIILPAQVCFDRRTLNPDRGVAVQRRGGDGCPSSTTLAARRFPADRDGQRLTPLKPCSFARAAAGMATES